MPNFNISNEINEITVNEFTKFVSDILNRNTKENIIITINSIGGSFASGMKLYNMIKALPNPVYIVIFGDARSIAAIIALATDANRRFCLKGSCIFFHSIRVARLENAGIKELKKTMEEMVEFNTNVENIVKNTTNIPEENLHHVFLEDENSFIEYKSNQMEEYGIAREIDSFNTIMDLLLANSPIDSRRTKVK